MKKIVLLGCVGAIIKGTVIYAVPTTNFTWTGASSTLFSTAGNWSIDNPPSNPAPRAPSASTGDDAVIFSGGVAGRTVDLAATARNVYGITFNSVAGANGFTLNVSGLTGSSSSFGLNLRPGGITNNDNDVQNFNVPVKLFTAGGGNPNTSTIFTLNNTLSGGGLTFSGNWTSGIAGKETINMNGGAMVVDGVSGTTTTIGTTGGGIISGTLSTLTKNGAGTLILGGTSANTYTGGTIMNSGTLTANKVNALGTGSILVTGGTLGIGANNQSVGAVIMSGGSITGSGILSGSSFSVTNGSISAVLGGTGATLTKSGSGTVTLSGANTYTGNTTVGGGNLKINNASGSGTGTGNVAVNSGGTLSGIGSIGGTVAINSGGTLAPGNSPGTLTTGSQTWNGGGNYLFQINKAGGTAGTDPGWSLANIAGSLTLAGTSGNKFTISLTSLTLANTAGALADFDGIQSYDWVLATTTTGITGFDASAFTVDTSSFSGGVNPPTGTFSIVEENGLDNLDLVYVVPEPSSALLGLCGGIAILAVNFYRRNRTSV